MDYHRYANTIRSTLTLDVSTPPFTIVSFALMNKQGTMGAYINSSGQLVLPTGSLLGSTTITGSMTVSGKTSGSLTITTADATAQAVTVSAAAQTVGASTLTIPDMAGANDTFAFLAKTQVLSGKSFSDSVLCTGTGGVGYGAGAGGTVTQGTSRTTAVTLNKTSGAITLFSAAGSATPASFVLTNSTIGANDTVSVSQKSGTDKYETFVTAVAAGQCTITFFTTGGTTTEQPVFNFNVVKGSAS